MEKVNWPALLHDLHMARIAAGQANEELGRITREFEERPDVRELKQEQARAYAQVGSIESVIRSKAIDLYLETKEKKIVEGIEIKIMSEVVIPDMELARQYCVNHMPAALSLNTTKFNAAVKAGLVEKDIAGIEEHAKSYIAGDLSKYLELE